MNKNTKQNKYVSFLFLDIKIKKAVNDYRIIVKIKFRFIVREV